MTLTPLTTRSTAPGRLAVRRRPAAAGAHLVLVTTAPIGTGAFVPAAGGPLTDCAAGTTWQLTASPDAA